MKLVYPEIQKVFNTESDKVNCIVIENQKLLLEFCMDIYTQLNGGDGRTIVSVDDRPVSIAKKAELIKDFIPFQVNKKRLLTKLNESAERIAQSPEFYEDTMNEMARLEKYIYSLIGEIYGSAVYTKIEIMQIIKAFGLQFDEDYPTLGEKILDYIELVRHYDTDKLFITLNLRSYIDDSECELFVDTVLRNNLHVIMIENKEYTLLNNVYTYIVDKELCEIA